SPCQHDYCGDCNESAIDTAANNGREYECRVSLDEMPPVHKTIEKDDLKLHGIRNTAGANRTLSALGLVDKEAERKRIQAKIEKEFRHDISKNFFMTRKLEAMREIGRAHV